MRNLVEPQAGTNSAPAKAPRKPTGGAVHPACGNTGIYQFTGASGVKITLVDPGKLPGSNQKKPSAR